MRRFMTLLVLVLLPGTALTANYKRDYCKQEEYVGNTGNKYPHLHCTKDSLTLSRGKSDHINFNGRPNCNKVDEVLDDTDGNYKNASNPGAITTVLQEYKKAGCP